MLRAIFLDFGDDWVILVIGLLFLLSFVFFGHRSRLSIDS